jgi:hypothetical protein
MYVLKRLWKVDCVGSLKLTYNWKVE